ncbi:MAG: tripartite tricarboxylate transporter substrate binding protein [Betaproteobacteria bacterium]
MFTFPQSRRKIMGKNLAAIFLATAAAAVSFSAFAQSSAYPSKPIRLIVPAAPGGGTDILGRLVGQKLSENFGQSVVIENRGGGGGVIAAEYVARMPPDGYTVLIADIRTFGLAPSLYKSLPYDPIRNFSPITGGVDVTNVLVVNPSVPAKTIKEFLAYAKSKPGILNYSSSGKGSGAHMAGELFALKGGVDITHVAYRGGGPAVADLIAGHVQFSFATAPSVLPLIQAGKLMALGVTTLKRFPGLPDVPTISEALLPGYEASNWYSFVVPAHTPKEIVARLNTEIRKVMADPEVMKTLLAQGMEPTTSSPEELEAYIKSEITKWAEVVKLRGIKPE